MLPETMKCYLVTKDAEGNISARVDRRPLDELPQGEVLVRVAYSSLNYKDALGATGHPGVNRKFPYVPGVDAAGVVVQSGVYEWVEGDRVVINGFDMGMNRWGGLAEYVRVRDDWLVPLPSDLTLRESMILGTAGFTAAQCVDALQKNGIKPDDGEIVVTGSTGGVGSFAVAILAKLGYQVAAVTGKTTAEAYLKRLGAQQILTREQVDDQSGKPVLPSRFAGAIDCVGGNILSTIIRSMKHGGCVAACGLTAGHELPMTVYPFILRNVTLAGIDSGWCPLELKHDLWKRLAGPWKLDGLEEIAKFIGLEDLPPQIDAILAGKVTGRVVVEIAGEEGEV